MEIRDASDNSGASMLFLGANGFRNFRVANQIIGNDIFEITPSTTNGGTTWKTTPAIAIQGTNNRVAINTTSFSGIDPKDGVTNRNYNLNIQGDININGSVFQNNSEFVTSRWTQATNNTDIYRLSKVGIGVADPTYTLQVGGSGNTGVNIQGTNFGSSTAGASNNQNNSVLYANADRQWLDTYGIFKTNRNTVAENVTIPSNTNAVSTGPITINSGVTVTILTNGTWRIV
jgi:hypothetical protein